jgi:hypothetical protein
MKDGEFLCYCRFKRSILQVRNKCLHALWCGGKCRMRPRYSVTPRIKAGLDATDWGFVWSCEIMFRVNLASRTYSTFLCSTVCVLSNILYDICSHRSGKHIAYPLFSCKVEFRIHFNVILRQTLAVNIIIVINSGNARRVKIVKNLLSYNYPTAVVVRNGGFMFVVKGSLFRKLESQ